MSSDIGAAVWQGRVPGLRHSRGHSIAPTAAMWAQHCRVMHLQEQAAAQALGSSWGWCSGSDLGSLQLWSHSPFFTPCLWGRDHPSLSCEHWLIRAAQGGQAGCALHNSRRVTKQRPDQII